MDRDTAMGPDDFQQAWQAQAAQSRVTVDADLLLKEVQRNQRAFNATILRRDVIEVTVGLVLLAYWIYQGLTGSMPWTWWLGVPALIWVIGFFVVDRRRHPQTPGDPGEPLLDCAMRSLKQVEHQIYLLRNVFWWYLMPFTIAIMAFFVHMAWLSAENWLEAMAAGGASIGFVMALYGFIDYINQCAVCGNLESRRAELRALADSLGGEESSEGVPQTSRAPRVDLARIVKRWVIVGIASLAVLAVLVLTSGESSSSYSGTARSSGPGGEALAGLVTKLRNEKKLVGLAAMVTVDGRLVAAAAYGERKIGSGVSVEIGDRWHLGGITKSITATMVGRLVEAGQLEWSDSVGEVFPEASIHEDWKWVTLRQLLTDTAGAPASFSLEVRRQRPALGPERTEARREAVMGVMAEMPAYPPGERNAYSNVGYVIAAAMVEKVTGATWEDLVKREVFDPLELRESGFGPPKSGDDTLEQPRGHEAAFGGKRAVDDMADNTPIMGPGGSVHMSLGDLCAFAEEHMHGELGRSDLLAEGTFKRLHTPALDGYACGWVKREAIGVIPYTVYWHNGSNTQWYALVAFIPEKNMVIAVASNDGDSAGAEAAAWDIVEASVKQAPEAAEALARPGN